jgi:hypothetical protein
MLKTIKKSIGILLILLLSVNCTGNNKKHSDKTTASEYIPNEKLAFIKEMDKDYESSTLRDKDIELARLLTDFLKTEESWNIDVNKFIDIPFILRVSSTKENNFRVFNIWVNHKYGTDEYTSDIIQYRTKTGVTNAVHIDLTNNFEYFNKKFGFNFYSGGCFPIFTLEKDAYLIHSGTPREMKKNILVAIKVYDENIEPYPVFNGKNTLSIPHGDNITEEQMVRGEAKKSIWYSETCPIDETPYWIKIYYNPIAKYDQYGDKIIYKDELIFTFNGFEFIGDYDKLNELR